MKILDYAVAKKLGIAFSGGAHSLAEKAIAQKLGGGSGGNTGGGGVAHLTFYNEDGSSVLQIVECKDGADGAYSGTTPTKASTAQYTYSFAGWSRTIGGAVDPDAMKNVTADRSLYAAFTAAVRKYTVYWKNGSTTLETDTNVPYGTVPTYNGSTPVDAANGYPWEGWTPTVGAITGNTTYTATFESPVQDVEITDSWETILANIDNGTYASVYKIGNYKPLDLGSEGVINMQIAAFDKDVLADGSGKAKISWVAKELLATSHRMNPQQAQNDDGTYQEGTGSIGGWEKCEMRTYLKETIKPLIAETVASRIVTVAKTQTAYNAAGASFTQTTQDDVWIPDYGEVFGSGVYTVLFTDNASRIKCKGGVTSASCWWLRRANNVYGFSCIDTSGKHDNWSAYFAYDVALGFCTN